MFKVGQTVKVNYNSKYDDEYDDEARRYCKSDDEIGIIAEFSDSHGLCYKVLHLDGNFAWYEPNELKVN